MFSSLVSGKTYYVNSKNGLNLRAEPSEESEIIEKLSFSAECEKIKDKSLKGTEWRKVQVGEEVGYVNKEFLQDENPLDEFEYFGHWHITAYTHTGNACANSNYPTAGYTIANNWLDFGTELYIDGIGFRTVEDRGPGWLGDAWLDLFCSSTSECIAFGDQYHDVYLVK